jgi:LysR family glycine cleavage system transcriptional activator
LFPEIESRSSLAYYAVYRETCAGLPRLVAFRRWLFSEAADGRVAS